jgi:hypothetical protein
VLFYETIKEEKVLVESPAEAQHVMSRPRVMDNKVLPNP